MKYAVEPLRYPSSEFPPIYPCDFQDAAGRVWELPCVFVDTESGQMLHFKEPLEVNSFGDALVVASYAPAPLTCIPRVKK